MKKLLFFYNKAFVYLLDEAVKMDKIGLISSNLAEKIASCVTENPKKDGKGNPYVDVINMHVPLRDTIQTASRRVFKKALL